MIEVFADAEAQAEAAAHAIAAALRRGIDQRARASFVATGGKSPNRVYDKLAATVLPWERVVVTLSDERSSRQHLNEVQVRERLLVKDGARARFVPLFHDREPEEDAAAAEAALPSIMPFDAVLLGMGPDGHIASLFPGQAVADEALNLHAHRMAVGVAMAGLEPYVPRVSLTLHALTSTGLVLVLISGADKRRLVEEGADGLPVGALLRQTRAPVRVLWAP